MDSYLEFKDIHRLIAYNYNLNHLSSFLKSKFKDFKLHDKIIDSYTLLLAIAGFYKINHLTEFLNKTKIKINFLLVLNLSSRDYLKYRISNLVDVQSLKFRFLNQFNIIRSEELEELLLRVGEIA